MGDQPVRRTKRTKRLKDKSDPAISGGEDEITLEGISSSVDPPVDDSIPTEATSSAGIDPFGGSEHVLPPWALPGYQQHVPPLPIYEHDPSFLAGNVYRRKPIPTHEPRDHQPPVTAYRPPEAVLTLQDAVDYGQQRREQAKQPRVPDRASAAPPTPVAAVSRDEPGAPVGEELEVDYEPLSEGESPTIDNPKEPHIPTDSEAPQERGRASSTPSDRLHLPPPWGGYPHPGWWPSREQYHPEIAPYHPYYPYPPWVGYRPFGDHCPEGDYYHTPSEKTPRGIHEPPAKVRRVGSPERLISPQPATTTVSASEQSSPPQVPLVLPQSASFHLTSTVQQSRLLELSASGLRSFKKFVEATWPHDAARGKWDSYVDIDLIAVLESMIRVIHSRGTLTCSSDWRDWNINQFYQFTCVYVNNVDKEKGEDLDTAISKMCSRRECLFEYQDDAKFYALITKWQGMFTAQANEEAKSHTPSKIPGLLVSLTKQIGKTAELAQGKLEAAAAYNLYRHLSRLKETRGDKTFSSFDNFRDAVTEWWISANEHIATVLELYQCGGEVLPSKLSVVLATTTKGGASSTETKPSGLRNPKRNRDTTPAVVAPGNPVKESCNHCGHRSHLTADCNYPHATDNRLNADATVPWTQSAAYLKYWKQHGGIFRKEAVKSDPKDPKAAKPDKKPKGTKRYATATLSYCSFSDDNSNVDTMAIDSVVTIFTPTTNIISPALFDTGAVVDNYGSLSLSKRLEAAGVQSLPCEETICSVFKECRTCQKKFSVRISLSINSKVKVMEVILKIFGFTIS